MEKYELKLYKKGETNPVDSIPFEADDDEQAIEKVSRGDVRFTPINDHDCAIIWNGDGKTIWRLAERDFEEWLRHRQRRL